MKLPYPLRRALANAALLLPAVLAGTACSAEPRDELPVVRGSPSPSAPVQLRYQLPERAPVGTPLAVELQLTTPLQQGELLVEVAKQAGLSLLGAAAHSVELSGQAQPIRLVLEVLPEAGAERYLVLLVTVHTESGPLARTFRIDLPAAE